MITIDELLKSAVEQDASDLHLCMGSKPKIRLKTWGELVGLPFNVIENADIKNIRKELLDNEAMKVLDNQRTVTISFSREGLGRFRAGFFTQRGSTHITIRILPFQPPSLEEFNIDETVKHLLEGILNVVHLGAVLIEGKPGSGKTTLAAAMVEYVNANKQLHIAKIENPIAYLHKHNRSIVTQKEIGADVANYEDALAVVGNEGADIIVIDETPNTETINEALLDLAERHLMIICSKHKLFNHHKERQPKTSSLPSITTLLRIALGEVAETNTAYVRIEKTDGKLMVFGYKDSLHGNANIKTYFKSLSSDSAEILYHCAICDRQIKAKSKCEFEKCPVCSCKIKYENT